MEDERKFQPRLCKVAKWPDFDGFGFNLHAQQGKAGQFIGKVDEGSPAEAAGLKQGDRIVEVDGMNISNENHKQVVTRIKAGNDKTSLLVVDSETDKYFKKQGVVIRHDLPDVLVLTSDKPRPAGSDVIFSFSCLVASPDTNEETGENGEQNGVTSADIEQNGSNKNEIDLDSDGEDVIHPEVREHVEAAAIETRGEDESESRQAEFTIPPPPPEDPDSEIELPHNDSPEPPRELTPEPPRELTPEPPRELTPEPREPTPEPVRELTPEPVRDPTPEPVRDLTPEPVRDPTPEPVRDPSPEPVRELTPEPVRDPTPEPVRDPTPEPVKPQTPEPVRTAPEPTAQTNGGDANGDPILRMSAKEMREQLAAKKKADAKSKKMGFKDKYDIFQRL